MLSYYNFFVVIRRPIMYTMDHECTGSGQWHIWTKCDSPLRLHTPKTNTYTGDITVKWMQGKKSEPIFQCKFYNNTNGQDSNCIDKRSSERLLLQGNHRKGDISLRINNLQFTDASQYTCRVELDYDQFNKHTTLNINGKTYTAFVLSHTYTVTQKVFACFWILKSHLME